MRLEYFGKVEQARLQIELWRAHVLVLLYLVGDPREVDDFCDDLEIEHLTGVCCARRGLVLGCTV